MTTSREMTTGPALPLILYFTLPLLLGNLLQQTYSLVDAAIVGQFLGIDALAGVGASSSVIFLILGFCNGCGCGCGIPVAQRFGARQRLAYSHRSHSFSEKARPGSCSQPGFLSSDYCAAFSAAAMRAAVSGWSPVIITVRMPARWASVTESRTSVRGGSIMPTMPFQMRSVSKASA